MRFTLALLVTVILVRAVPAANGKPVGTNDSIAVKLDAILAEPKPQERLAKLNELGTELSAAEIPQALTVSAGFKQWRERAVWQQSVFRRWAELTPADAFDYIAALPESSLKLESLHAAAINWAHQNADKAAAAASRLSSGPARTDTIIAIAAIWAQTNVTKALAWVDSLPEAFAKQSAQSSIFYVWVHNDPVACWTRVQKLPPGSNRKGLIINIANDWAALDPSGAIRWANALPDEAEKELALQDIAESWADKNPVAAGEFALKLPAGNGREFAAAAVVAAWGIQNPQQAAAWLLEKLDPASQQQAVPRFLMFWAAVDPQASGQWVDSLPAGALRDAAISSYNDTACYWTPARAAKLALTLKDESLRRQKLEVCLQHWLELDANSLQQWLKMAPVPADLKDRWQAQLSAVLPNNLPTHP